MINPEWPHDENNPTNNVIIMAVAFFYSSALHLANKKIDSFVTLASV